MVRWEKNKIVVGHHEWAWSLRTQGFEVYAIFKKEGDGNLYYLPIGRTKMRPSTYVLPEGTVAVFKFYRSNVGCRYLHVYTPDGKRYDIDIDISENYEIPEDFPVELRRFFEKFIEDNFSSS